MTWYEVYGLRTLSDTYTQQVIDLDAAIADKPLNYTSTFRIRFNQYDNFSVPSDGIAIDNLEITGDGPAVPARSAGAYVDPDGLPHAVWVTTSGTLYQFQFKTNLTDTAPWQNSGGVITSLTDTIDIVDSNAVDRTKFYRLLSD